MDNQLNGLMPRMGSGLQAQQPGTNKLTRQQRGILQAVEREHGHGLQMGARMEGGAYATHTALMAVAVLSKMEEACFDMAPHGAARYKAIVDGYTMYALKQLGQM